VKTALLFWEKKNRGQRAINSNIREYYSLTPTYSS